MQSEVNYALDLPNENVSWNWKVSMPLIITSVESFTCGSCEEHNFLFNAHNAQLTRKLQPSLDPMRAFNEMFQFISASRGFRQSSMTSSSLSWNCHIAISPINSTKPKPIPRPSNRKQEEICNSDRISIHQKAFSDNKSKLNSGRAVNGLKKLSGTSATLFPHVTCSTNSREIH